MAPIQAGDQLTVSQPPPENAVGRGAGSVRNNVAVPAPDVLPVGLIPEREDPIAREGRTAGLQVIAAVSVGAVLAKAARDARLPWWWLNFPMVVLVGLGGSLAGLLGARAVDLLSEPLHLRTHQGSTRFWVRYISAFVADTVGFVLASEALEGRSLWRGSPKWGWTIGWPLATLMMAANAIDVEAGERVVAARGMMLHPVTNLRNRRAFDADLASLARNNIAFVYVLADLDHLKEINDLHGHASGDAAVKHLAAALDRQGGFAYHWGGDEFVLLLSYRERKDVQGNVQSVLDNLRVRGSKAGHAVSASFGVAFVPEDNSRSIEQIGKAADDALYEAKRAGRGRAVLEAEPADR